jgi:hypothetical protein
VKNDKTRETAVKLKPNCKKQKLDDKDFRASMGQKLSFRMCMYHRFIAAFLGVSPPGVINE